MKNLTINYLFKKRAVWQSINVVGMFPSKHSPEITQIVNNKMLIQKNSSSISGLLKSIYGFDLQMAHAAWSKRKYIYTRFFRL